MAMSLRYRVDAAPAAPVTLAMQGGAVDLTALLRAAPVGVWRTAKVRLSCLRDAGAKLAMVETPFAIGTAGRMALSVSEIRLASNENDTICPGR